MNRPIKFRAWHTEMKKMVLDGFVIDKKGTATLESFEFTNQEGELIWMQFTGLLDKNGKEVYESDVILFHTSNNKTPFVVEYRLGGFYGVQKTDQWRLADIFDSDSRNVEVIGNVFENPELLNDKQKTSSTTE